MKQPCSEFLYSGTFLGTSQVDVKHCGLDECVEAVEGFMVVNTEDEVCLKKTNRKLPGMFAPCKGWPSGQR